MINYQESTSCSGNICFRVRRCPPDHRISTHPSCNNV